MSEEKAREAVAALWRNHPKGASTFGMCKTNDCRHRARDIYCDRCVIDQYNGDKMKLIAAFTAIKAFRTAESNLCEDT